MKLLNLLLVVILTGCSVVHHRDSKNTQTEVSLKQDLNEVESAKKEMRKDIPEIVQKQNDDLAVIFDLMKDESVPPQTVRQRYLRHVEKVRRDFRKQTDQLRDNFNKVEKENRKAFLDDINEEKEDFKDSIKGEKYDKDKTKEFYDKTEFKRKDYFDDERTKRKDFESDMRQLREDFNSRMRDSQLQFNDSIRLYEQKQKDKKSSKVLPSGSTETFSQQNLESGP